MTGKTGTAAGRVLAWALVGLFAATASADIVTRSIQHQNDDAEEYLSNFYAGSPGYELGDGYTVSSDLEMGSEFVPGCWSGVGLQYDQLGIPQGAIITSARLTFTVDEDEDPGTSNDFTIFGEKVANASLFNLSGGAYGAIVPFDISSRTRTGASTAWSPTDPVVGLTIDTPDLTGIIQEIVDQAGWSANNRLTLILFPDAYLNGADPSTGVTGHTYEAEPGPLSALLTVEFAAIPEPATMALFGFGALVLLFRRRIA